MADLANADAESIWCPAFMLWHGYGTNGAVPTVVVPVLVMAAGQLSGGLAWLAISGEDAPQLVATAPVTRMILRAKIEASLRSLGDDRWPSDCRDGACQFWPAFVALVSTLCAATGATMIQRGSAVRQSTAISAADKPRPVLPHSRRHFPRSCGRELRPCGRQARG
ncbi:MAG: hypothetical protein R3D29_05025 [Nitratireductor sp.]